VLEVTHVSKDYPAPAGPLRVLSEIDLSVGPGESVSIVGPSGSGKSTLLYILGALEPPTSGTVLLDGQNPFEFDDRRLAAFRNRHVGFVFQDHHLLPQCSVIENVLVPTLVDRDAGDLVERRARDLLDQVGLAARSCREARGSAWRSPGHWCRTRASSCATSRPAISTRNRPMRSPRS
jgi:lipoprotein-releasing system ATP-binding protein